MNFEQDDVPFLEQHGLQFVLDAIAIVYIVVFMLMLRRVASMSFKEWIAVKGNDIDDCEETKP